MRVEHEKRIKEIMAGMECPTDFSYYELGLNPHCTVKDVALDNHLDIEGSYDYSCKYLVVSRELGYCRCPLCVYLTKKTDQ